MKTIMFTSDRRTHEINWFPFRERTLRQLATLLKFRHGGRGLAANLGRMILPLLALLLSSVLHVHAATPEAQTQLTIDVRLTQQGHGMLGYLIFASPSGFPADRDKAIRRGFVPVPSGAQRVSIATDLPPGTYAASVYEDLNGNHKLDHNFLGIPTEPIGVSGDSSRRFGPPRFDDCSFDLGHTVLTIIIVLMHR
jgi:uncharacterized protein (DUF2141 family)